MATKKKGKKACEIGMGKMGCAHILKRNTENKTKNVFL